MTKRQKYQEEYEATVAELPLTPPDGTAEELIKRGFLHDDVLIYKVGYYYEPLEDRKKKGVLVHCTACGEESYLEYYKYPEVGGCRWAQGLEYGFVDIADGKIKRHSDKCVCPSCKKAVKACHSSYINSRYEIDNHMCLSTHSVRGHLCLLSWTVHKETDKSGIVSYRTDRIDGAIFIDGVHYSVTGFRRWYNSFTYYNKWQPLARSSDRTGEWDLTEVLGFSREVVDNTDSANSALFEYVTESIIQKNKILFPEPYLTIWCKYPNIENLVRQGYVTFLNSVIEKCFRYTSYWEVGKKPIFTELQEYINFKKAKPHEMIGVEKNELPIVKKCDLETLEFYKNIRDVRKIKLDKELLKIATAFIGVTLKQLCLEPFHGYNVPVIRALRYLYKQRSAYTGVGGKKLIDAGYLRDYWDAVYNIYGEMKKSLLFPKDLVSAHDHTILQVKVKANAAVDAAIKSRLPDLEKYCFKDDELGLLIRPAASYEEFVKEGDLLHHCVARYAEDHSKKKTTILFIRKIADPDIPFFTLELIGSKVQQNRGLYNCARTPEVTEFEKRWREFVIKINAKEKKNVKRNDKESKYTAA